MKYFFGLPNEQLFVKGIINYFIVAKIKNSNNRNKKVRIE